MVNMMIIDLLQSNFFLFYGLCNDPKAKMLEKSRMVTRKRGIDLREET